MPLLVPQPTTPIALSTIPGQSVVSKWQFFFRQLSQDCFKVGFRSKGNVDVGALARAMGGGGHHNAAGATVDGTLESVQEWVYKRVAQLIAEHQ